MLLLTEKSKYDNWWHNLDPIITQEVFSYVSWIIVESAVFFATCSSLFSNSFSG